jgi:hypothetical protein
MPLGRRTRYRSRVGAARTFNPPPNWPTPPPAWQPPPGWEPNPEWGPPPPGWQLHPKANPHPFLRSFGLAFALYVVVALVVHATIGLTAYSAGALFGSAFFFPALITGFIVRSRPHPWPRWKLVLTIVGLAVVTSFITALGRLDDRPQVTESTPVSDIPVEQLQRDAREATRGIFSTEESDCIVSSLVTRSDLTVRQVLDYFERPTPGAVETAYGEIVPACVDPAAVVEPAPISPVVREGFVNGLRAADPSFTDEEANCLLDGLFAQGVTARQLTLSGYDDTVLDMITPQIEQAALECLPG